MNKKIYKELNETIYSDSLENGLSLTFIPKNDYSNVYAILFTDYGSIDNFFIPRGEQEYKMYPYGVAHFLEHKLFETEDGDVSQLFSSQGASVNAYTSNTKTAFLCSFSINHKKNIETLLDFVQNPFFDSQSVENEKSIISQEIAMYKDDPDWALTQGLLENLYPDHPVRVDVAGTPESVESITVDMLRSNYQTFYHPANMKMVIIGNIEPTGVLQWLKQNQSDRSYPENLKFKRKFSDHLDQTITGFREINLPVKLSKVLVGVRGDRYKLNEEEAYHHIICMDMLLDLLFGETSLTYLSLYNNNLIDDSFSYDYIFERGFDYVSIGGDSRFPEKLQKSIRQNLKNHSMSPDMTKTHFSLVKKRLIGEYIQNLNSMEFIAHQFIDLPFNEVNVFDYLSVLREVTFEEIKTVADEYFKSDKTSVFTVKSQLE